MNAALTLLLFFMVAATFVTVASGGKEPLKSCHTFHAVQNSHMRTNSCTGEAHMIYKDGKGGFEWVRVNE